MGAFGTDSRSRTDASVTNNGASDYGQAVNARGKGAIGTTGDVFKIGKGGKLFYTLNATTTNADPDGKDVAKTLAKAINDKVSGAFSREPTSTPGASLFAGKTAWLIGGGGIVLVVILFFLKRR